VERGRGGESDVGVRLRRAIEEWSGGGIKAFHRDLGARAEKVPGSSYTMIHKYLKGTEPPLGFIAVAAETLGVQRDWLAFGAGPMRWTDVADEETSPPTAGGLATELIRAFFPIGVYGRGIEGPCELVAYLMELTADYRPDAYGGRFADEAGAKDEIAATIVDAVLAPLLIAGISPWTLPASAQAHYVTNLISALAVVVPPPFGEWVKTAPLEDLPGPRLCPVFDYPTPPQTEDGAGVVRAYRVSPKRPGGRHAE
jgi:hypothetical protein